MNKGTRSGWDLLHMTGRGHQQRPCGVASKLGPLSEGHAPWPGRSCRCPAEISERLHLSEGTVRNYLSSAIVKLNARNRTEAFARARDRGFL